MSLINEALKHAEREKLKAGQVGKYSSDVRAEGKRPIRPYDMRQLLLPAGIVFVIAGWATWSAIRPAAEGSGNHSMVSAAMAGPVYRTVSRTPDASASLAHHKSLDAVKYFRPAPVVKRQQMPEVKEVEKVPALPDINVAANTAATAPVPNTNAAPTFDPGKFKLSGIMSGPDGKVAVINNHPVHTGEIIDQAKVINIGTRNVVLEIAGQRITIRM